MPKPDGERSIVTPLSVMLLEVPARRTYLRHLQATRVSHSLLAIVWRLSRVLPQSEYEGIGSGRAYREKCESAVIARI